MRLQSHKTIREKRLLNARLVVRTEGLLKFTVLYSTNASSKRCDINWILNNRENLDR